MRGSRRFSALHTNIFKYACRKRRSLNGVCTRAEFVYKNKRAFVNRFHNIDYICHVSGESRKRLLNALLVAYIRKNVFKYGNLTVFRARKHQSALRHKRKQTECFYRNGFTARIGSGYNERVKFPAQTNINRYDLLFVNKRMSRLL